MPRIPNIAVQNMTEKHTYRSDRGPRGVSPVRASLCPLPSEVQVPEELLGESLGASLTVRSLEDSVTWYTDVLGFAVDRRHERGGRLIAVSLRAGAVQVLLTQDDGAKGLERSKGEGLSLQITTHQEADALAAQIKSRGWSLDTEPVTMPHGARAFRLRDPDGFRLTISSTRAT